MLVTSRRHSFYFHHINVECQPVLGEKSTSLSVIDDIIDFKNICL